MLALAVFAAAALSMVLPAASIGLYFERSYNEGWNAYHQARAAAGEPLYGAEPWRPVNYPFLSFYLVGWLGRLFGNVLIAGRVLNLAGLVAMTISGALVVRRLGGGGPEMLFAAGCVIGFQEIQAGPWLAADEPQMLAEAFALGGFLCYLSGPPRLLRLLGCALLFVAGGFVKAIVVVFPVAVTVDLLGKGRRQFPLWFFCLGLAAALFATASAVVAGGDFLARMLEPRIWLWQWVFYHSKKLFFALKAPLAASIVALSGKLPPGREVLLRVAGIAALGAGIAFAGGDGVSANVFLELAIVMGLIAGLALARWRQPWPRRRVGAIVALLLPLFFAAPILALGGRSLPPLWQFAASWRALDERQREFLAAAAWLRAQPGAALCESLLLCFAAGKPLVVDPYNAREEILTGRADEAALGRMIGERRFAAIALPSELRADLHQPDRIAADQLTSLRFTPATLAAIAGDYAPAARFRAAVFYTPRRH